MDGRRRGAAADSQEANEAVGSELTDREAMSLLNANVAIPINAAVAANVLSDNSVAHADAEQAGDVDQPG